MRSIDGITKVCSKCKETKLIGDFGRQKHSLDGRSPACRLCESERNRERYQRMIDRPVTVPEKLCPVCELVKPAEQFNRYAMSSDGLMGKCKACASLEKAKRYQKKRNGECTRGVGKKGAEEPAITYPIPVDDHRDPQTGQFLPRPDWERFWEKVDVRGDNECWPWKAGATPHGYGMFWLNGKTIPASRAIWILLHGEIPSSAHVCHDCDNPPCCNPAHLWEGTTQENTADCVQKGRHASQRPKPPRKKPALRGRATGEKHPAASLTNEQARQIRQEYKPGGRDNRLIAQKFGVSVRVVWMIGTGRSWRNLTP